MDSDDVEWFPKNKAMCLKQDDDLSEGERMEEMLNGIGVRIDASENRLSLTTEKRTDKLLRMVEVIMRQQKEATARLEFMSDAVKAQGKQLARVVARNGLEEMDAGPGGVQHGRLQSAMPGNDPIDDVASLSTASLAGGEAGAGPRPAARPAWEERVTVEVLDAVEIPNGGSMGALIARVSWNGEPRGETETMWMGPKPSWFVGNKFNCRRGGDADRLTVNLVRREQKKKGSKKKSEGEVVAMLELGWPFLKEAVLQGTKTYFPLVPSGDFREVAPDCQIGLKLS